MAATLDIITDQSVAVTFRNVRDNLRFAAEAAPGFYAASESPSVERIAAQVAGLHGFTVKRVMREARAAGLIA